MPKPSNSRFSTRKRKVNAGWITDDEASETITGHKAKGVKAQPVAQPSQQPGIGNTDGQPAQQDAQRWLAEYGRHGRM